MTIPLNPRNPAELRNAFYHAQRDTSAVAADLAALVGVAVTADGGFGTDNVLVQSDGLARKVDATTIPTANVVTAASNFGAADQLIVSSGTAKALQSVSIVSANLVTEASAAASSGLVMQSAGANKTISATATLAANLVTASSAFGANDQLLLAAGNDKTSKSSTVIISDITTAFSDIDAIELTLGTFGTIVTQDADNVIITGGSITGITELAMGTTDNAVLRADGTGGSTLQSSTAILHDPGDLELNVSGATLVPVFGAEQLSASGWTSTNWTGSWASGWTHTTGNTTALTNTLAAVSTTIYHIAFTVTGRTAGSFTIGFGGQTSPAFTSSDDWGPLATSTGSLSITPTSTFDGTIIISIKAITAGSTPGFSIVDSDSAITLGIAIRDANQSNTFFGKGCGSFVTSGAANVGVGTLCLTSLTSGDSNVVVGESSGQNLTTGLGNVIVGRGGMQSLTTGSSNVGIGQNVLVSLVSGSTNIGLGRGGSRNVTTGAQNVGIGYYGGSGISTGNRNTCIGRYSMYGSGKTGSDNTCIGGQAGRTIITGSNNTCLGTSAGFNASQKTDAASSTCIGVGSFNDADNQVVIGSTSVVQTILRGIVDVRNATTAQILNIYNTFTSSVIYERLACYFSSNVARIETQKGASGGTARALALGTDSTVRLTLNADGTINLGTVGNLPTSEPASGTPGTVWVQPDGGSANSGFLMVTTS